MFVSSENRTCFYFYLKLLHRLFFLMTTMYVECFVQLAKASWTIADVDLFEINEAFASQSVAVVRELGIDVSKVSFQSLFDCLTLFTIFILL